MKKTRITRQARSVLDHRFEEMRPVGGFTPPMRGWISAIRQALGMSTSQLAKRLGIKQPTVSDMEKSEVRGTIQLSTLQRAAEALDCTLIYALVPNKPLDTIVRERARQVARRQLEAIDHTMSLENQKARREDLERRVDGLAEDMDARVLWDET